MNIVVFGASGRIGRVIVDEALARGHGVTAAARSPDTITTTHPRLDVRRARIDDDREVAAIAGGHDAVVDAVGGLGHDNPRISIDCAQPLIDGMTAAGVARLLIVGTAGTLEVQPGLRRMDTPDFPDMLKGEARAHEELQRFLRDLPLSSPVEWTYFSPPGLIEPGERTGAVTLGGDSLPFNDAGESYISNEDYAVAVLDELEEPRHIRRRFCAVSNRTRAPA